MTDLSAPALPDTTHTVSDTNSEAALPQKTADQGPAATVVAETSERPSSAAAWPSATISLKFPLQLSNGHTINAIVFPEPDLETIEKLVDVLEELGLSQAEEVQITVKQMRPLISALSGIPRDDLKRLHFKDVLGAMEVLSPLLVGLTT